MSMLKKAVQNVLVAQYHREYEAAVRAQSVSEAEFQAWRMTEYLEGTSADINVGVMSLRTLFATKAALDAAIKSLQDTESSYLLLVEKPQLLHKNAIKLIRRFLFEKPYAKLAYPDEAGWLKPDFSPDTLLSQCYFGRAVLVERELLATVLQDTTFELTENLSAPEQSEEAKLRFQRNVYRLILNLVNEAILVEHIPYPLYLEEQPEDFGREECFADLKKDLWFSDIPMGDKAEKVSIIILSKDNPRLLSRCVHSLMELTDYPNLEVIVLDNGSNPENKAIIEKMVSQQAKEIAFRYEHRPQAFNFSALCNQGAQMATGEYVLFLNDDTEVVDRTWLTKMMEKARKDYVGAVGIKLLYPDEETIQHAGVNNIHLGPCHKLQTQKDTESYYFGWNRQAVNTLATTGACLLMKKALFDEVGGFSEDLAVAFNDVELCFRLYEKGYRNVTCNHTHMLHYESVSRGSDEGIVKLRRLHGERDKLYAAHPGLWNRDPYHNPGFVKDIMEWQFRPGNRYQAGEVMEKGMPVEITGQVPESWHNDVLYHGIEFAGSRALWETGKNETSEYYFGYYIQGWFYAVQVDNSRYKISLLMRKLSEDEEITKKVQRTDGPLYQVPFTRRLRPDYQENLPYIQYPALSGMSVTLDEGALPPGEYLLGYLWEDRASRQKMYDFTAETIVIS